MELRFLTDPNDYLLFGITEELLLAEGEPRTGGPGCWREVFASGRRRLSLNNFEVRFALRLAVVMTISTTVSLLWEFEHTYLVPAPRLSFAPAQL